MFMFSERIYDDTNIISFAKSNIALFKDMLEQFDCFYKDKYYIYFLDGDDWGKRDMWIKDKALDIDTLKILLNMITYKDALIMGKDEFILISEKNLDLELKTLNISLSPYSFTILKFNTTLPIENRNTQYIYCVYKKLEYLKYKYGKGEIYANDTITY